MKKNYQKRVLALLLFLLPSVKVFASDGDHGDPFASIFMALAIILICALTGRFLANKLKQSTVLGELVMGIILGTILVEMDRPVIHLIRNQEVVSEVVSAIETKNISLAESLGQTLSESTLSADQKATLGNILSSGNASPYINLVKYIQLFSAIGISMLLFMVGLEGSIQDLLSVGVKAILVAVLGISFTLGLGYLTLKLLLTVSADPRLSFFGAATICSTSAGITARVLKDLNKLTTAEAKITMGAAVFDDILGLILLAVLANVMVPGELDMITVGWIIIKIVLFLVFVFFFGLKILPRIIPAIEKLDPKNIRLLLPFILMLALCYLANAIGLAMIIGAYFAGLMITDDMFSSRTGEKQSTIESLIAPIEGIFVPVFFVLMGMQVDITLLADIYVIGLGLALSLAAILGKLVAGIFLPASFRKIAVGWGMVPRGEVVLIFASIGKTMGIISPQFYAATVVVILITILVSPLALMKSYQQIKD